MTWQIRNAFINETKNNFKTLSSLCRNEVLLKKNVATHYWRQWSFLL